ncbi:SDR family oxidoreductase [Rhizobium sp. CG5]|uniref:SDR family oxidoreductase n=1 Tax=Rhizobium sp. CG5 TaxID=2726076 RepID=UPI0020334C2E|nr:SDR family oxidoreductase [Rhizobium sp. CG5]MCM2477321.1 SDR family oxidoreductase [Rhizobium sp. CG5]
MKHILIIGGTAGIGRELAASLLTDGAKITIAGRDSERAKNVARDIQHSVPDATGQISGIAADLSKPEGLREALAGVSSIDHLVLVGMVRDANTIKTYNIAGALELVTTKTVGYPAAIAAVLDRLSPDGSVLIFGGVAKDIPYPGSTTVTVVNNAVMGLVKTLSIEITPIRVNAIHPGMVEDSPYWQDDKELFARMLSRIRSGRFPQMADIVDGSKFLMSNRAANGVNLTLDGGQNGA